MARNDHRFELLKQKYQPQKRRSFTVRESAGTVTTQRKAAT